MHPVFLRVLQFYDLSIAGDLFAVPDTDVIKSLPQIFPRIEDIIRAPAYLSSVNDQSVVEISITRITAAIRQTDSLSSWTQSLLNLLKICLSFNLTPGDGRTDPPHAKIASDLVNCVFLNYTKRDVMEAAIPVGLQLLQGQNSELTRNMSCYFALIAIQHPFLVAPYFEEIIRIIQRGNLQLTRILPQIFNVNPKLILDNIKPLVQLLPKCDEIEKENLLHLCNLVVKNHPQSLWPVVGDLVNVLSSTALAPSVFGIFTHIASNNAVPFLTHMGRIKKAIDGDLNLISVAATVFGAVGRLGESVAKDLLQYLVSRSVMMDRSLIVYMIREINTICQTFPPLVPEVQLLLSRYVPTGNENIIAIAGAVNNSAYSSAAMSSISLEGANYLSLSNQPPPYASIYFGQHPSIQKSPFSSRTIYGQGKTSAEIRQIATAGSKFGSQFSGSSSNMPLRLTSDMAMRTLTGGRGPNGTSSMNVASQASHQSLISKGNSRHSLASSGLLSTVGHKESKHSVSGNSRQTLVGPVKLFNGSNADVNSRIHLPVMLSSLQHNSKEQITPGPDSPTGRPAPLNTFVVENPCLSKSSEAINVRSRRNSRHSLAPRPRSRVLETGNQPQVIQVVPIHDAVYQFCERNLEKIKKYMSGVLVRFPLPTRCSIELHKSRKQCKLFFACQCKGDQCLYATRFFSFRTRIPKIWIHLMFLAIQAKANAALNQQDSAIHGLKLCWDHLNGKKDKDFSTLVTSAFPSPRDQEELLRELSSSRYFDVFEYNGTIKQWGCFLCNYPEKATALFSNGMPIMEGILKEKKGRWQFFKRWRPRYFTLSGPYLSYKPSTKSEKVAPIDMRRIRSVKAKNGRGVRSIPTVFEIFTNDNKIFLLKAKDSSNAEQWLQCLQIAMVQSQSEDYGRIL